MEKNKTVYRYLDRNSRHQANAIKIENEGKEPIRYSKTANGLNITEDPDYEECLYNEDKLALSDLDTVYVAEGEKDADTLTKAGFLAVTNINGAQRWPDHAHDLFRNRCVVICEDNDPAGRSRTTMLVEKLSDYVSEIRLVSFKGQQEKYDVTKWFEDGGDANQFGIMADDAPVLFPEPVIGRGVFSLKNKNYPPLNPLHWCIGEGMNILIARQKIGKTRLATAIGRDLAKQHKILQFALEDNERKAHSYLKWYLDDGIEPHIILQGEWRGFQHQKSDFIKIIDRVNPDFIIADTLVDFIGAGLNMNDYSVMSKIMGEIKQTLDERNIHSLFVHHASNPKNGNGSNHAPDHALGSTAITSKPDNTLYLTRPDSAANSRFLTITGNHVEEAEFQISWDWDTGQLSKVDPIMDDLRRTAPVQHDLLKMLKEHPNLPNKQYAEMMGKPESQISTAFKSLSGSGLIGGNAGQWIITPRL